MQSLRKKQVRAPESPALSIPFAGFRGRRHEASERDRHLASGLVMTAGGSSQQETPRP